MENIIPDVKFVLNDICSCHEKSFPLKIPKLVDGYTFQFFRINVSPNKRKKSFSFSKSYIFYTAYLNQLKSDYILSTM